MKLKKTIGTAILGSLVAATSFSVLAQGQGAVEIEGFAKRYFTDSTKHADDGNLYGVGLGYFITDNVELALSYGEYSGVDQKKEYGHNKYDGNLTSLDAIYHFGTPGVGLRPYLSAGVAHQSLDQFNGHSGRDKSTFGNLGAGFKWYIAKHFYLKPSVDYAYNFPNHESEWYAGIGAGLNFGGNYGDEVAAAPAPAPVPAPEPEAVPETVRVELDVKFDFDKAVVKPQYLADIQNVADFLKQYPQTNTVVEGHTDSVGTDAYNQRLSERRANAVRKVLVDQYGISSDRVSAVGYGESRPVADNATAEGRAINRRVEAAVEAQKVQSSTEAAPEAQPEE